VIFLRIILLMLISLCLSAQPLTANAQSRSEQNSSSSEVGKSTEEDEKNVETEFFWTMVTPIMTHAGIKLIDWYFNRDSKPSKETKLKTPDYEKTTPQLSHSLEVSNPVGIVYRLYRLNPEGSEVIVGPNEVFNAGERIIVKFLTNLPGMLKVTNVDAAGQMQHLGQGYVEAGWVARIGPFEFYGSPGVDILTLHLQPCNRTGKTDMPLPNTLKLSYPNSNQSVQIDAKVANSLPSCAAILESSQSKQLLESLMVVDEETVYLVTNNASAAAVSRPNQAYVGKLPLRHH